EGSRRPCEAFNALDHAYRQRFCESGPVKDDMLKFGKPEFLQEPVTEYPNAGLVFRAFGVDEIVADIPDRTGARRQRVHEASVAKFPFGQTGRFQTNTKAVGRGCNGNKAPVETRPRRFGSRDLVFAKPIDPSHPFVVAMDKTFS